MAGAMIRAARIEAHGEPPRLAEIPLPEPPADGSLEPVDLLIAGLNPVDLAIASGKFDAGAPPLPYTPGLEGIGRLADGRIVWFDQAAFPAGSIAERCLIPAGSGIELPAGASPAAVVGFGIAGSAAWLGLEWRGRLEAGETVVVLGASGVVGQVAIQAARLLGAGRVVGAARSPDGIARVESLGADAVVSTEGGDLTASLLEATGDGADLVLDNLWGEPARAALRALKPGGRLVQVGNSADRDAVITAGYLRGGNVSILGHRNFFAPAAERARVFHEMCFRAAAGELRLDTEVFPLVRIADAWAAQASSPGHKLAISPR